MTKDDVQNVVFVINPASSPGLTSMNWLFLQNIVILMGIV